MRASVGLAIINAAIAFTAMAPLCKSSIYTSRARVLAMSICIRRAPFHRKPPMTIKSTHDASQASLDGEEHGSLKNWAMTIVTAVFVLFYAAALLGWIKPLTDERVVARL